jgi:hypothetical protein
MNAEQFYDEFKSAMRHLGEWPGTELHVHLAGDSFIMTDAQGRTVSFTVGSRAPDLTGTPCDCKPRKCKLTSERLPDHVFCKRLRT